MAPGSPSQLWSDGRSVMTKSVRSRNSLMTPAPRREKHLLRPASRINLRTVESVRGGSGEEGFFLVSCGARDLETSNGLSYRFTLGSCKRGSHWG